MTALAPGDLAPDFSLPLDDGSTVSRAGFGGRKLALFFYPKADTSGCTREAQAFSALQPALARARAVVLGVSVDSLSAQQAFKAKYGLGILVASDETMQVATAYGVRVEKSM